MDKHKGIGDSDIDLGDTSMRSEDPMELGWFTAENSNFDEDYQANIDRVKKELEESLNNQEDRDSSSRPREKKEKSKEELEEEDRVKMQLLVSNFTADQLKKNKRPAALPKAATKTFMQTLTGKSISESAVIAVSGIAKVFVGEVVKEALDVMESRKESGTLQPIHLREAVRRLREKRVILKT